MADRHPRKGPGFTWSRTTAAGIITYRLFWRTKSGKLYMVQQRYRAADRGGIACDLRRLINNARVMRRALDMA